jgi:prephenate dehydrogenase
MTKTYRVAIVGLGRMGRTIDNEMPAGTPVPSDLGRPHGRDA